VDLRFGVEDESFRAEARRWLEAQLGAGRQFESIRGRGGPGDEHALFDERLAWERALGAAGWTCVGWPVEHGGRGLSLHQQVIWFEEYARARGPGRLGHIGETLAGPTILAFGSDDQKARFLPGIRSGTDLWCQGYSEPNAGSDLANVATRAERDGDEWVIDGQKVWTSLAHWADWCFVLCRTDRHAPKHRGISYLLVPMRQPGVEVRPIRQLTGTSEFNEVFFDGARTAAANVVGAVNGGWKVAMGTLAFERGASTLGQQLEFANQLATITEVARKNRRAHEPVLRQRLVDAWAKLQIMRWNTLRMLSAVGAELPPAAMITKLYWATWHRELGELAMDVLGPQAELAEQKMGGDEGGSAGSGYELTALQRLFLFTRSDTIYAGSNQIQRNIIGERALGLPPEPKGTN
jgi:alkylation response protein AidB-like acyl-CoA dehydrogenase